MSKAFTETDQRLGRLFDAIESGMVDKDDAVAKERIAGLKALRDQAAADAERTQLALDSSGNQAVSYTTGVPAMIGAAMILTGAWKGEGVFNMEQFDPDPFMEMLNQHGLPWQVKELAGPLQF